MKKVTYLMTLLMILLLITSCTAGGDSDGIETVEILESISVEVESLSKVSVIEEVYAFGYLEPIDSYYVTPFSTGIVNEIMVSTGDYIEKGTVLYQLDTDDLELSKDRDLIQKESNVENSKSSLEVQALTLDQRKGDLEAREMNYQMAETDYENSLKLYESGAISKSEMDAITNNYEQARISYDQSQSSYEATLLNYNLARSSYDDAIQNHQLAIKDYDSRHDDMLVTAPISGLVTDVSVQTDTMNTGNLGITIIDNATMVLNVNVMEKYIRDIEEGQKVRLLFDYMNEEIEGDVTSISLESNSGYYPVEINIINDDQKLTSGMYTEAYVQTGSKESTYMVNKTSIVNDNNQNSYVFVVNQEDQTVKMVNVTLGIEEDSRVEIIGDIQEGDQIVVVGQDYLSDGQSVKIVQ